MKKNIIWRFIRQTACRGVVAWRNPGAILPSACAAACRLAFQPLGRRLYASQRGFDLPSGVIHDAAKSVSNLNSTLRE
ncbi:hypothetical protein PQR14_20450 [Paraburkholderia bryophila]|uniref:hypothetical protein n=1 Tax=Burkholderiaceae TaxID=119060 RepID=UPI0012E00EB0|nr:hypothetical protein [Burkholderia sp. 9120]